MDSFGIEREDRMEALVQLSLLLCHRTQYLSWNGLVHESILHDKNSRAPECVEKHSVSYVCWTVHHLTS